MKKIIFLLSCFLLFLYIIFSLLDLEAERVVWQLYSRSNGIINGAEDIAYENNHKKALIFIHGHMETAGIWRDMVEKSRALDKFDAHALLLPYHGRDLKTATKLDNEIIYKYLKQSIQYLSKKYDSITVVGLSYGGLLLAKLAKNNDIPTKVNVVLYSPATHIISNDILGFCKVFFYTKLFRTYCNYENLGCGYPVYESTDEGGRKFLEKEINLRYRVMPAILAMYNLDRETRGVIEKIKRPFFIIAAKDDNRVNYPTIMNECRSNKQCKEISFLSGKHMIHYGKHREEFFKILQKIVTNK